MKFTELRRYIPPADIMLPVAGAAAVISFVTTLSISTVEAMPFDGDGINPDRPSYIVSLNPERRVSHDYSGTDGSGDDCLEPTGYDIWEPGHNKLIAVGKVSIKNGIIVVEPGKPDQGEPALRLLQNDGSEPLQPADEISRQILADSNCALKY